MTFEHLVRATATASMAALLTACATQEAAIETSARADAGGKARREQQQLRFRLASGVYLCEAGQKIEVQRDTRNANLIELSWQGNRHTLQRHDSSSGLPRYEDRQNGLLWVDLPWKSVLMDVNSGRPLANECKAAPAKSTIRRAPPNA
ncbi:MliC family protein [Accumulibacter sp.]|uniref:MliC family protein n=1 Tax=Accumulibacter sp. TaxID=2053492 RepID=UPI0026268003|nr:MliC family protein [Accumulibacter sp.]